MLNENKVLEYIKTNLSFTFQGLELEDEKIMEYVKINTLMEFSHYIPYKKIRSVNLTTDLVPGKKNEYFLNDSQNLEILNIRDVYFDLGNEIMFGHPVYGPLSFSSIPEWALSVEMAGMVKKFSNYNYSTEFIHPNMFRILPVPKSDIGFCAVEYETMQPDDFSGVANDMQMYFMKFALADIMILLGRVRKRYGDQLRTPFGEIPLSSEIFDEGKELKREMIDKFEQTMIPNITFSKG